jgi:FkbM family methyltransferase
MDQLASVIQSPIIKMNTLRIRLRRYPRLFDGAKWVSRKLGNRTALYSFLESHIPKHGEVTFIQAGAADGLLHDPYREFILRGNMRGVLVEPLPFQFSALKRNYAHKRNVFFENCAISYPANRIELFVLSEEFVADHPQREVLALQASTSRERFINSLSLCGAPEGWKHVMGITVYGKTIEEMMLQNGFDSFDCIFLDMEGYEPQVLLNLDFATVQPKLIVYEHVCLGASSVQIEGHLAANGFVLTRFAQDNVAVGPEWLK